MPEDRLEPQSRINENGENAGENSQDSQERFVSDTQKIIHRHLQNKNDVITDEDIASVRVGMTPPSLDQATEARFEDVDKVEEAEEELMGDTDESEEKNANGETRVTPWDTIDPEK